VGAHRRTGGFSWTGAILAFSLASGRAALQAQSVDDLITRHTEAVGGQAAIELVHNISLRLRIVEPGSTVDAVYVADRQGRMRIDVYAGGERVYTEAYDGREAWALHRGATAGELENASATAALRHSGELPGKVLGLHELRRRGIQIDLEGREAIQGIEYFVLRLVFPDGFVTHVYLNPDTFLIERTRDLRPLHPDSDPGARRLETLYSDFRTVGGTVRAFKDREIDFATGMVLSTTDVQSIQINIAFDSVKFARPR
jgi:hypothetical protein